MQIELDTFIDALTTVSVSPLAFGGYLSLLVVWGLRYYFVSRPSAKIENIISKYEQDSERNKALSEILGTSPPPGLPKNKILEWADINFKHKKAPYNLAAYLFTLLFIVLLACLIYFSIESRTTESLLSNLRDSIKKTSETIELLNDKRTRLLIDQEKYVLRAPFDGVWEPVDFQTGMRVRQGFSVGRISDMRYFSATFSVSKDRSSGLVIGMLVDVELSHSPIDTVMGNLPANEEDGSFSLPGRVSSIYPTLNELGEAVSVVRIELPVGMPVFSGQRIIVDLSQIAADSRVSNKIDGVIVPSRSVNVAFSESGGLQNIRAAGSVTSNEEIAVLEGFETNRRELGGVESRISQAQEEFKNISTEYHLLLDCATEELPEYGKI